MAGRVGRTPYTRRVADEAALLALLWRDRGSERAHALSTSAVVGTAIALADAEGIGAVSMRHIAARLGAAAMSLYTHVPDKSALVALMTDEVLRGMPVTEPAFGIGWRARLRLVAGDNRDLLLRHPWLLETPLVRAPLGPGLLAKYEWELSAFHGLGLSAPETDASLTFLLGHVRSATADAIAGGRQNAARAVAGPTARAEAATVLARHLDEDEFPLATRIGGEAAAVQGRSRDPDGAWSFGLERALDGVAALVARG